MSSIHGIRKILSDLDVTPRKSRGQNFLLEEGIAAAIAREASIEEGEAVLEVGPGLGVMTRFLVEASSKLFLAEIERKFCEYLQKSHSSLPEEQILCEDFREITIRDIDHGNQVVVVSNVPYSLSSEMVLWLIAQRKHVSRAVLLLQKEFAERIAAREGSKQYGSLSVLTRYYAESSLGFTVSGDRFFPRANVDSRVLHLRMRPYEKAVASDEQLFEKVLRASFATRRKTMLNCLSSANLIGTKPEVREFLLENNIEPSRRAETLTVDEFVQLSNSLSVRASS